MQFQFRYVIFLCLGLIACNATTKRNSENTEEYLQSHLGYQDDITTSILGFSGVLASKDLKVIEEQHGITLAELNEIQNKVNRIKTFSKDENLHAVTVQLTDFYLNIFKKDYKVIMQLMAKSPLEEADKLEIKKLITKIRESKKPINEAFVKAKEAYRKKFSIPEPIDED